MSPLEQLQLDVEGFLLSLESLQYCAITHVRPRSAEEAAGIQGKLDQTLKGLVPRNGKMGISIIVSMPSLEGAKANVRAVCGDMVLTLMITEKIMVNMGLQGTGMSAEEVALEVAASLQQQSFAPWGPMIADPKLITPEVSAVKDGDVVYSVTMRVSYAGANKAKTATPKLTQAGNEITLSCGAAGAQLYYTLDESFPGPGNADAVLYDEPFALPQGESIIRYAAYLTGCAGSHSMHHKVVVSA